MPEEENRTEEGEFTATPLKKKNRAEAETE
jgi:hypothetical protein